MAMKRSLGTSQRGGQKVWMAEKLHMMLALYLDRGPQKVKGLSCECGAQAKQPLSRAARRHCELHDAAH